MMNKEQILNEMNKTAEETKKMCDTNEFISKTLRTFYNSLINKGFDDTQAFVLTQQYFDRMLEEAFSSIKRR